MGVGRVMKSASFGDCIFSSGNVPLGRGSSVALACRHEVYLDLYTV